MIDMMAIFSLTISDRLWRGTIDEWSLKLRTLQQPTAVVHTVACSVDEPVVAVHKGMHSVDWL